MSLKDTGVRIDYGEGKAIREPCTGKGRYDLVSPFAIKRIAMHYEAGAKKYTRTHNYNTEELLVFLENEVNKCPNVQNVKMKFIQKGCAEIAMSEILGVKIQNSLKGKEKTHETGEKNTQNIQEQMQRTGETTHTSEKETKEPRGLVSCEKEDSQKRLILNYWNGKKTSALYVEENSMPLEPSTLIMTMTRNSQEEFYAVGATTDLECLRNLLKLFVKLSIILNPLQQIILSPDNNHSIIVSGDRNWEKGMPFSRCLDSAKRHLDQYIMGEKDEDHIVAAIWNLMAIVHFEELHMEELNDLPKYKGEDGCL